MRYIRVRLTGHVDFGGALTSEVREGGGVSIERNGDTLTIGGNGVFLDVPWSSVQYAQRAPTVAAPQVQGGKQRNR